MKKLAIRGTHFCRKNHHTPNFNTHSVVFLRHGESIWNKAKRFSGWSDIPLTDVGLNFFIQAYKNPGELVEYSKKKVFSSIFASHLTFQELSRHSTMQPRNLMLSTFL